MLGLGVVSMAQGKPCYSLNMQVAQVEFDQQQFSKALQHFEKAKICAGSDTLSVNEWIARCKAKLQGDQPVAAEPVVEAPIVSDSDVVEVDTDDMYDEDVYDDIYDDDEELAVEEPVVSEPVVKESVTEAPIVTPVVEEPVVDPSLSGYMQINRVEFANYKNEEYLSQYGGVMYASDMRYLVFKLFYDGLDSKTRHDISFKVKLMDAQGKLVTGKGAPEGFSAGYEMTVMTGKGRNEEFPCRGRGDTSIYRPGTYTFEVWYEGRLLHSEPVTFLAKAGEPTYLSVNGEHDHLVQNVKAGGERKVYSVETDGASYRVDGINERWVTIEYLPDNHFAITYRPDYSKDLTPYAFSVSTSYMSVDVDINYSREDDLLYQRAWDEPLTRSMDVYNLRSELDVVYKGELTKREKCDGYGVNMWPNGSFYFGTFVNNHREGNGVYFIPQNQQMSHAAYYVGEYGSTGLRNGQGRLYDVYGNLIYDGAFFADRAQGSVPMANMDASLKFVCERYSNDALYVGETRNGVRHGYGIYVYPNGDLWYGQWENGVAGQGFYSYRHQNGVMPGSFK